MTGAEVLAQLREALDGPIFALTVRCENEAFAENPEGELNRILKNVAERLLEGDEHRGNVLDVNGNVVGTFALAYHENGSPVTWGWDRQREADLR